MFTTIVTMKNNQQCENAREPPPKKKKNNNKRKNDENTNQNRRCRLRMNRLHSSDMYERNLLKHVVVLLLCVALSSQLSYKINLRQNALTAKKPKKERKKNTPKATLRRKCCHSRRFSNATIN